MDWNAIAWAVALPGFIVFVLGFAYWLHHQPG